MTSDADSSSPKRAASQDIVQENPSKSSQNLDTEIDTYMAEQGEADIPQTLVIPTSSENNVPPAEKLRMIESLSRQTMQPGETWFLVARPWYKRWHKACSGDEDKEGRVNEADLGPVDNSPLLDNNGVLTSSTQEHVDVEFMPVKAWQLFVEWYACPDPYHVECQCH